MVDYKPLGRLSGTVKEHVRRTKTVCQECTVGCGLIAGVQDERVVDVQGDEGHPVSRGRLCAKGIAFAQALRHPDRVTLPGTRNRLQGPFEAFDNWEKGLDQLAERLRRVKDRHGPESLAIGCDPMAGLDFLLGAKRFARLWGTPHVYDPLDDASARFRKSGIGAPTIPFREWAQSRCLFLVEADIASTHPVAFQWILEARRNGAKIVAADSRFTPTLSKADESMVILPESGNLFGAFILKALIDDDAIDEESASMHFPDSSSWKESFGGMSPEEAPKATGIEYEKIVRVSRMLSGRGPVALVTGKRLAFLEHHDVWPTLATAAGWIGRPGAGWHPMESGAPNLDVHRDISEEDVPKASESGRTYPYQTGERHRIADEDFGFKALIGSGNCLEDFLAPFKKRVGDMELNVLFGAFPNETRRLSHMFFPAALWPERSGLCFSDDRIVQWGERIAAPDDACRTGLGFWMRLAQRMGWEEHFPWKKSTGLADHEAFFDWVLANNPDTEGIAVETIREAPGAVFWPSGGLLNDKPPFFRTETGGIEPAEAPSATAAAGDTDGAEYPLEYLASRVASRAGDPTRWQPWTRELADDDAVQIHPDAAEALGIENGDEIVVAAEGDSFEGRAWIVRMVGVNTVWSSRRIGHRRVLVHKKGGDVDQARNNLRELLQ